MLDTVVYDYDIGLGQTATAVWCLFKMQCISRAEHWFGLFSGQYVCDLRFLCIFLLTFTFFFSNLARHV